jgi:hypothetical protein
MFLDSDTITWVKDRIRNKIKKKTGCKKSFEYNVA